MRNHRSYALGATLLALAFVLGACGSGGGGKPASGGGGGGPVAAQLVLGAPPECPKQPYCLPGLKKTYGIEFKDFVGLQAGPPTVAALKANKVQVAELFSTDPAITENDFVILKDDKHLQAAGNIVPAIRKDADDPTVEKILGDIDAKLDTQTLTELVGKVTIDHQDPEDVAKGFLQSKGVLGSNSGGSGNLTVGVSGAFAENQIVASMYAQALQDAGYSVDTKLNLGSRQVSDQALFSGVIDIKPEYVAYELSVLDPKADAGGPAEEVLPRLKQAYAKKGIVVLDQATPANDTNAFVVTPQTADRYNLTTISDLAE
jgi:osmoprotectant transport system substrate-binding protein